MANELTVVQDGLTIFQRLLANKSNSHTRRAYERDLREFTEYVTGGDAVDIPDELWVNLTTTHVAGYLEHLQNTVSERTGNRYSTATVAQKMVSVKELLTEAKHAGLFPQSRLDYIKDRIKSPKVESIHHGGITADEQARILRLADGKPGLKGSRDYTIFRLWLDSGLRRAELVALAVRDLTVKSGVPTLTVRHGKGDKPREIGLPEYTNDVIKKWLRESGQGEYPDRPMFCRVRKLGRGEDATYQVFNPTRFMTGQALWKLVEDYCREASIESKVTTHSFRVSFVTDMVAGGASLEHVRAVTGHKDLKMIIAVYNRNKYSDAIAGYRKHELPKRGE